MVSIYIKDIDLMILNTGGKLGNQIKTMIMNIKKNHEKPFKKDY